MKKVSIFILMILAVSAVVNLQGLRAESYQFEVNGDYYYQKADYSKETDYELNAGFYFEKVNLEGRPYMEAAFLQKAGYVSVFGAMGTVEYGDGELDGVQYGAEAKLVLPMAPLFVKLKYERVAFDGDIEDEGALVETELTYNTFSGDLGYYILDSLAAAVTYSRENEKADYIGYDYKEDNQTDSIGGYIKFVTMFENNMGVNLECSYVYDSYEVEFADTLKNKKYGFVADLYVTPQIAIGGSALINTGDDKEYAGNTYLCRASAFVTANIGIEAEYGVFKVDDKNGGEDNKQFTITLTGRI